MLYYNQISKKQDRYALNFNGTNQYLQSQTTTQGGKDFVHWERTQPWTFFVKLKLNEVSTSNYFFSTQDDSNVGIAFGYTSLGGIAILIRSTLAGGLEFRMPLTEVGTYIIQVTYNGNSHSSGIACFLNGIQITPIFDRNNLTGTIINSSKNFSLGRLRPSIPTYFEGEIHHLSFIDYVKSPVEIATDFNLKKQTKGTGEWLLAPIEPIYIDSGEKQIKTLSAVDINTDLPNPNAFTNEQGYKLNLINYPTTLVKGTDLIKL